MADYTKTTDFASKDGLATGNPSKIITGTAHDTEYNNIATAIATKANITSPTLVTPAIGVATGTSLALSAGATIGTSLTVGTTLGVTGVLTAAGGVVGALTGNASTATTATTATTANALAATAAPKIPTIIATLDSSAMTVDMTSQYLDFRSTTLTSGTITSLSCDPTALVVPSGATLGTTSGVASRIAVAIVNDGGTAELAVANMSGLTIDESALITTTTIGTGSDSTATWYSTTGTASKAFRIVGYIDSTQATAGVWATALTQIQGVSISQPTDYQQFTASGTWTKPSWVTSNMVIEVELWGGGGGGGGAGFGGGGGAYQCRRFLASELSSSETVTVGAGGVTAAAGGYSQFGAGALVKAYGGGYATAGGGGGGGGGLGVGGSPLTGGVGSSTGDIGGTGVNSGTGGYGGIWGGGGGGASGGGTATFGGGGGTNTGTAGTSKYGGAGGTSGNNGTAPGGGGGGLTTTGGRGEVRVRVLA